MVQANRYPWRPMIHWQWIRSIWIDSRSSRVDSIRKEASLEFPFDRLLSSLARRDNLRLYLDGVSNDLCQRFLDTNKIHLTDLELKNLHLSQLGRLKIEDGRRHYAGDHLRTQCGNVSKQVRRLLFDPLNCRQQLCCFISKPNSIFANRLDKPRHRCRLWTCQWAAKLCWHTHSVCVLFIFQTSARLSPAFSVHRRTRMTLCFLSLVFCL